MGCIISHQVTINNIALQPDDYYDLIHIFRFNDSFNLCVQKLRDNNDTASDQLILTLFDSKTKTYNYFLNYKLFKSDKKITEESNKLRKSIFSRNMNIENSYVHNSNILIIEFTNEIFLNVMKDRDPFDETTYSMLLEGKDFEISISKENKYNFEDTNTDFLQKIQKSITKINKNYISQSNTITDFDMIKIKDNLSKIITSKLSPPKGLEVLYYFLNSDYVKTSSILRISKSPTLSNINRSIVLRKINTLF